MTLRTVRNHDGTFDLIDARTGVVLVQGESIVVVANIRDEIEGKIGPDNSECSEVAQSIIASTKGVGDAD